MCYFRKKFWLKNNYIHKYKASVNDLFNFYRKEIGEKKFFIITILFLMAKKLIQMKVKAF